MEQGYAAHLGHHHIFAFGIGILGDYVKPIAVEARVFELSDTFFI